MRVIYFDCFAGVSGDMIVGALLDLGLDLEALKRQLASVGLTRYQVRSHSVERGGIAATKFDVEVDESVQPARTLGDIRKAIAASTLSEEAKARAIRVFERLAEAEARVHGSIPEQIHFHEVGAVDSIVDIVGSMIAFELLGVEKFLCSPLRVGGGLVETAHGVLPVPAPATAELLRGAPVYAGELEGEFVTPTGAAIVATLCEAFGGLPPMKVRSVGYGAGSRDPKDFPNALRLVLGDMEEAEVLEKMVSRDSTGAQVYGWGNTAQTKVCAVSDETIFVVETNIDDMNPQAYGFVMERAFALGALDVFLVAAQMKKDRPGTLLTVLCKRETLESVLEMLLAETTTLGIRYYEAKRRVLERAIETVETDYGSVRVKVARHGNRTLHFQPEYEDCSRRAIEAGVPLLEVQAAASAAYRKQAERTSEADGELKEKHRA